MTNPLATTLTKPKQLVLVNQTKTQLEEKIESITAGALPPYLKSMFSDLASANLQNAQILYNFLLTGQIEELRETRLRHNVFHIHILIYKELISKSIDLSLEIQSSNPINNFSVICVHFRGDIKNVVFS